MVTKREFLITAGPTWVALDKARVISNIASGQTGIILAKKLKKLGKVTLLFGPGYYPVKEKGIKIIRFKFFNQLKELLEKELKKRKYNAIIHTAAVSDYIPKTQLKKKISSGIKNLKLNLVPTEKLIDKFKKHSRLFKVGFKFEPETGRNKLLKEGNRLLADADLDLVVANTTGNKGYVAYILGRRKIRGPFSSKEKMAAELTRLIKVMSI